MGNCLQSPTTPEEKQEAPNDKKEVTAENPPESAAAVLPQPPPQKPPEAPARQEPERTTDVLPLKSPHYEKASIADSIASSVANSVACSVASGRRSSTASRQYHDSTSGKSFDVLYIRGQTLGQGAFSVVIEAMHKKSGETFAVKIVYKSKLSTDDESALRDEIAALEELQHQHIIRLYDVFEDTEYIYLVTERMRGGELFGRIVQKVCYTEKEARDVCQILLRAIQYCHSKNVVHRDLKPENLLLRDEHNDWDIKIADFGFAKRAPTHHSLTTQCGTPAYVAPEILKGVPYGTKADMWSLGVIVYILIGGYPPFVEKNQRELFRRIRKGQYEFHPGYWDAVSQNAKDFITGLLTVDPSERLSASEALQHRWMMQSDEFLTSQNLGSNLELLKKTHATQIFRGAVNAVILATKANSLGDHFRANLDCSLRSTGV